MTSQPDDAPKKTSKRLKILANSVVLAALIGAVPTTIAILLEHRDRGTAASPPAASPAPGSPSPSPTGSPSPTTPPSHAAGPRPSAPASPGITGSIIVPVAYKTVHHCTDAAGSASAHQDRWWYWLLLTSLQTGTMYVNKPVFPGDDDSWSTTVQIGAPDSKGGDYRLDLVAVNAALNQYWSGHRGEIQKPTSGVFWLDNVQVHRVVEPSNCTPSSPFPSPVTR